MIFSIILIKNTNNLLLELGPLAVKTFFFDVATDILKTTHEEKINKLNTSVLGSKIEQVLDLVTDFCKESDTLIKLLEEKSVDESSEGIKSEATPSLAYSELDKKDEAPIESSKYKQKDISDKVRILIQILNDSIDKNPRAKTIIFVKDRSVACYLKKILVGT
jgi:hypothetical protein